MGWTLVWLVAGALCAALPARADGIPQPSGEIVLTISGAIGQTNAGTTAVFDRPMLEALGRIEVTTNTIWTEGEQVFAGVRLATLLAAVEAKGTTLRMSAVNDYAIDVPASDAVQDGPDHRLRAERRTDVAARQRPRSGSSIRSIQNPTTKRR